jgi:hypothetical protein
MPSASSLMNSAAFQVAMHLLVTGDVFIPSDFVHRWVEFC